MLLEGNSAGSKAPQFRMDGCVEGLVCKTVYDNAGPEIRVRKDDGFTPSQELPSPPEKESEDMVDRVARLMKATKSDEGRLLYPNTSGTRQSCGVSRSLHNRRQSLGQKP